MVGPCRRFCKKRWEGRCLVLKRWSRVIHVLLRACSGDDSNSRTLRSFTKRLATPKVLVSRRFSHWEASRSRPFTSLNRASFHGLYSIRFDPSYVWEVSDKRSLKALYRLKPISNLLLGSGDGGG